LEEGLKDKVLRSAKPENPKDSINPSVFTLNPLLTRFIFPLIENLGINNSRVAKRIITLIFI